MPSKENKGVGPTRGAPCTSRTLVAGTYRCASAYMQLAEEHGREWRSPMRAGWKQCHPVWPLPPRRLDEMGFDGYLKAWA